MSKTGQERPREGVAFCRVLICTPKSIFILFVANGLSLSSLVTEAVKSLLSELFILPAWSQRRLREEGEGVESVFAFLLQGVCPGVCRQRQ